MKIQSVEFPLDVIFRGIHDVFPLLKILPIKTSKRNPIFIMEDDMDKIIHNIEYRIIEFF